MINWRIVDLNTFHIVVLGIIGIKHSARNIRNILSCITLSYIPISHQLNIPSEQTILRLKKEMRRKHTSNINIESIQIESSNEILPETFKLCCHIRLIVHGDVTRWESRANRLIDVDNIAKVSPSVGILSVRNWLVLYNSISFSYFPDFLFPSPSQPTDIRHQQQKNSAWKMEGKKLTQEHTSHSATKMAHSPETGHPMNYSPAHHSTK